MLRRSLATIALALGLGVAGLTVAAAASADTVPASNSGQVQTVQAPTTQNTPSFWW